MVERPKVPHTLMYCSIVYITNSFKQYEWKVQQVPPIRVDCSSVFSSSLHVETYTSLLPQREEAPL